MAVIFKDNNKYVTAFLFVTLASAMALVFAGGCDHHKSSSSGGDVNYSSLAYKGHANDTDASNLILAYQFLYGTRLDDCQTCHKGGDVQKPKGDSYKTVTVDPCTYCHYIEHPQDGWLDLPTGYDQTLNPFGMDYMNAGRDAQALRAIEGNDSDGDGYTNIEELQDLKYPGDAGSMPGQTQCPTLEVSMNDLKTNPNLTEYTQLMLMNTNKQQFDDYAYYTGVRFKDLLRVVAGVDLDDPATAAAITGIQVLAPDGYALTFTVDQIRDQFPDHHWYEGLGAADLNECAFVNYPPTDPGLADGQTIPNEQWHLWAYEKNGQPIESSYLDPVEGRIVGEGPFRNAIPPWDMSSGSDPACDYSNSDAANYIFHPDWGKGQDTGGCASAGMYPFTDCKSHNAGFMAKGAVIIKIEPMPTGCEEFDIVNGGWALVDGQKFLIYGYGVNMP